MTSTLVSFEDDPNYAPAVLMKYSCGFVVKAIRSDVLEKIVSAIPVKRLGTPDEIASMCAYIASDDAAFATGADFSLNGGIHTG